jgi:SAM-dependent methyltransferase
VIAESALEWLALRVGRVPLPLVDTQVAFTLARAVMEGARLGVFAALADGPRSAEEVAARCGTDPGATDKLLMALAGVRYLRFDGRRYRLAPRYRKWLVGGGANDLSDKLTMQLRFEWRFTEHFGDYLETGEALDYHERLAPEEWGVYQRGLRALATLSAAEVAQRTPIPRGATALLDIGGAHGVYAAALCRRHPALQAVILDLPEAVAQSAPLLAAEGMGERVRHLAADAFATDLGEGRYDAVFTSQFSHHFDADRNRDLARRVARALRSGGVYVIQDLIRPATPQDLRRASLGALMGLFFAATSAAGTWSLVEMAAWQREAGLRPLPARWLRTLPGAAQQVAVKL